MKKENKIIYLEWLDSTSHQGWQERDEDYKITIIKSVGYLVSENDQCLTITTSIETYYNLAADVITIPKCAITKRKYIKL